MSDRLPSYSRDLLASPELVAGQQDSRVLSMPLGQLLELVGPNPILNDGPVVMALGQMARTCWYSCDCTRAIDCANFAPLVDAYKPVVEEYKRCR